MNKTLALTGHRPEKLPQNGDENSPEIQALKRKLHIEIQKAVAVGYQTFITGLNRGVDFWCAEEILKLKEHYPFLKLIAALPCVNQFKLWQKADTQKHLHLLSKTDDIYTVTIDFTPTCIHERNRYMVDQSSRLIAVYDGNPSSDTAHTVNYAKARGLDLRVIWLP